MTEYQRAINLANKVLDRVGADPDDDIAVLARCLLRIRDALAVAQEEVCSNLCPSTWKTAEGRPPHSEKCQGITYMLGMSG